MKQLVAVFTLIWIATLAVPAWSQEPEPSVVATPLGGNLHRLTCLGTVHAVASVGEDGILLVDSCYDRTAQDLLTAVRDLGEGDIRYVINTHAHGDHVGGNAALGARATVIAHSTVRDRASKYYALPPVTTAGLPQVEMHDEITLHFNGETIRLIHLGVAHTDGDVVVHFTGSGVACLGDLVLSDSFPGADLGRGGRVDRQISVIGRLLELLPADVRIVPSHGRELTMAELRAYHEMMVETTGVIRQALDQGLDSDGIVRAGLLDDWRSWSNGQLQTLEGWIGNVASSTTAASKPSISEPLSETIVADGVDAAVRRYHQLTSGHPDDYDFGEAELNNLGYQLLARSLIDEAIEVFKLNVAAYPDAFNPYDSLGEGYLAAGETELAIANYERSLVLNPDNTNAAEVLARIRPR
jgi:glyoxylase-like metal-dependent hydrolase (beta-lactamase superfamily II)